MLVRWVSPRVLRQGGRGTSIKSERLASEMVLWNYWVGYLALLVGRVSSAIMYNRCPLGCFVKNEAFFANFFLENYISMIRIVSLTGIDIRQDSTTTSSTGI